LSLFLRGFVFLIYLSLLYELVGIPVPSVASTYQLFFTPPDMTHSPNRLGKNSLLAKVKKWPWLLKILFLMVPTGIGILIYLIPLTLAIWPPFAGFLHFVLSPSPIWLLIAGCGLAVVGRTVGLSAATIMHKQPESEPDFSLKTRGVFSFTRNPILIGMHLTFIGLWLLFPSVEMGIGFILFACNMHFRVLLEEDFLLWRYGETFQTFIVNTKRYF
jgi:protein-S-isoprenylcysteine O-methyltransferase Ste14